MMNLDGSPSLGQTLQFIASPKDLVRDLGVDSELQRLQELNRTLADECEVYRKENERLRRSYLDEQQATQNLMTDLQVSQLLSGSLLRQNQELAGLLPVYEKIAQENARHRRKESGAGVDVGSSGGPTEEPSKLSSKLSSRASSSAPSPRFSPQLSAPSSLSLSESSGIQAESLTQPARDLTHPADIAVETERTYQKLYTALVESLTSLVGERADDVLEASKQSGKPPRGRKTKGAKATKSVASERADNADKADRASFPPAGPTGPTGPATGESASANPFTDKTTLIRHYIRQIGDVQSLMDQLHSSQTEAATLRKQLAEAGVEFLKQQEELESARKGAQEAQERYEQLAADYQKFCEERKQEILDNKYRFMSVQKTYDMLAKKYASLKQMTQEWLETRPYRPAQELACVEQ